MSHIRKQKLSFWNDILTMLRCNSHRHYGPLELDHQDTIAEVLYLWLALSCDLLKLDPLTHSRQILRYAKCLGNISVDEIIELCDFVRAFITHYEDHGFRVYHEREFRGGLDYRTFKQFARLKTPSSTWPLLFAWKSLWIAFLRTPVAATFLPLNQLCTFPTRLNIPRKDLEASLTEQYIELDSSLQFVETDFVRTMRDVIESWFLTWKLDPVEPHHGPGSCAEISGRDTSKKYHLLGGDNALFDWIRSTGQNPWMWYHNLPMSFQRRSKLVFVPKSAKTLRAINKEPATLMYWQQGVKDQFYNWIDSHNYLSKIIILDDASINAEWALDASRDGGYATIDLSSASDTVSYDLVKYLFARTSFLPIVDALRAEEVELPDGRVHKQNKFAPMGNALCFPMECIIFASVIEATMRSAGVTSGNRLYKVYGDDMVVPDYFSVSVIRNLESLGFIVNTEKTFSGYDYGFRESCGLEAYLGYEVSPIRISRSFCSDRDMRHIPNGRYAQFLHQQSLVPLYNSFYTKGYSEALLALSHLIDFRVHYFSEPGKPGLDSSYATNYHLRPAFIAKSDLQTPCYFIEAWNLRYRCDDALRLHHWFVSFHNMESERARISKLGNETYIRSSRIMVSRT